MVKTAISRMKKFSERTAINLPADTFAKIHKVQKPNETRADIIREAVTLQFAVRDPKIYHHLSRVLLANESPHEFIVKAVARGIHQRKTALGTDINNIAEDDTIYHLPLKVLTD